MSVEPTRKPHALRKTVPTAVDTWYKPKSQTIGLFFKEFGLITSVSEKLGYKPCHRHRYDHLRNVLTMQGIWPEEAPR